MIQINDLDLSLLQFDFELTWSVFILNADRTLYGRYGTRSFKDRKKAVFFDRTPANIEQDGLPQDMSIPGFKSSLRAALSLHQRYQADASGQIGTSLSDKVGKPWPWKTPSQMPGIRHRACTHCHQVNSNLVLHHRAEQKQLPDQILWSYPMPDLLGMILDPQKSATIKTIVKGSETDLAGIQAGDQIISLAGQPILSPADVQWVLQQAKDGAPLKIQVQRSTAAGPELADLSIPLTPNWRRRGSFSWRWRSLRESLSKILGGESWHCDDLSAEQRTLHGLTNQQLGVIVLANMRRGKVKLLQKGDVIVRVDDQDSITNASELLAYVMQEKDPGSELVLSILRKQKPLQILVPVIK